MNPCKQKAATNVRSNKTIDVPLDAPKILSLDEAVEFIVNDEVVEITPNSIRIAKIPDKKKRSR